LKKSRGGCLSAVIFLVVLIICICLIYKMIDSSSGGKGPDIIDTVLDRLGYEPKSEDSEKQPDQDPQPDEPPLFENVPDANVIKIELTQEKLLALLQQELDDTFPMTLNSIEISADAAVSIDAAMERDAFLKYVEENESAFEGVQILLLKLAPAQIDVHAVFELSYDASEGKLNLDPEKFTVQSIEIPVSLIPAGLTEKFNVALDGYTAQYGYRLAAIEFYDGYMQIYIE